MDIRINTTLVTLALVTVAAAQGAEPAQSQAEQEAAEEILIIGNSSLLQLRTQLMDAEKEAYNIFNKFNDEARFDINCSVSKNTGSYLPNQVCQPNFVIDAHADHGREYYESLRRFMDPYDSQDGYAPRTQPPATVIARQQKEYREKMQQVAEDSPEFLQALIKYSAMRKEYEAATGKVRE